VIRIDRLLAAFVTTLMIVAGAGAPGGGASAQTADTQPATKEQTVAMVNKAVATINRREKPARLSGGA
jgi:hypothetical protein